MNNMLAPLLVGVVAAGAIALQSDRAISTHWNPIAAAATAMPAPTPTPTVGPGPTFAPRTPAPSETLGPPRESPFPSFNPTRPPNATLLSASGVMNGLGFGIRSGGFAITTSTGTEMDFEAPVLFKINGVQMACRAAPQGTIPGDDCPNWPTKLVIGKTNVRITYWKATFPTGKSINASDEIDF